MLTKSLDLFSFLFGSVNLYARYLKRPVDLVGSLFGLVVLAPVLVLIAMTLLIKSGRPIFFIQKRIGRDRIPFSIVKFRTMHIENGRDSSEKFEAGDSSRISDIGRFLRRTKLDELPQLYNVLIGDMSLVGPRPEVFKWTQIYPEHWDKILKVRPGITDLASIKFRDEEKLLALSENPELTYQMEILPKKIDYYTNYVSNIQFSTDLKILKETLLSITSKS